MPTLAPISLLPTPLLEEICILYVWVSWTELVTPENQHQIGHDNPVCLLALVCRTWQATDYGCRRLWNRIDLTRPTRAQFYLEMVQGVPIHIQWLAHPAMSSTQIVHNCDSIFGIRDMEFPILKKLSLGDNANDRNGGLGSWLPASLPVLLDLRLVGVKLDRNKLFALLKTCRELRTLQLITVVYQRPGPGLALDAISLPHLQNLTLSIEMEIPCLLLSLAGVPKDCIVTVHQTVKGFDVAEYLYWRSEAWRRLYPFKVLHIR